MPGNTKVQWGKGSPDDVSSYVNALWSMRRELGLGLGPRKTPGMSGKVARLKSREVYKKSDTQPEGRSSTLRGWSWDQGAYRKEFGNMVPKGGRERDICFSGRKKET